MRTEFIQLEGGTGTIDLAFDWPDDTKQVSGWCLMMHPHPLYSGTRENKVVTTVARAVVQKNFVCIRPNFRGVGQSTGTFDHAEGETQDMLEVLHYLRQQYPDIFSSQGVIAGFSFGSVVASKLTVLFEQEYYKVTQKFVLGQILIGTAVVRFTVPPASARACLIHGELDTTIPLSSVLEWANPQDLPVTVVPGADHFFHKKLISVKNLVTQHLSLLKTYETSQS